MKNNLNRIDLIIKAFCNKDINPQQMTDLINKYGVETDY